MIKLTIYTPDHDGDLMQLRDVDLGDSFYREIAVYKYSDVQPLLEELEELRNIISKPNQSIQEAYEEVSRDEFKEKTNP